MAADVVQSPAVNLASVCDVVWLFGCRLSACPLGSGCGLSLPKKCAGRYLYTIFGQLIASYDQRYRASL